MFCQNSVTCPSIGTDPGIRTHTGAGDTVWQPILNLYSHTKQEHWFYCAGWVPDILHLLIFAIRNFPYLICTLALNHRTVVATCRLPTCCTGFPQLVYYSLTYSLLSDLCDIYPSTWNIPNRCSCHINMVSLELLLRSPGILNVSYL